MLSILQCLIFEWHSPPTGADLSRKTSESTKREMFILKQVPFWLLVCPDLI